MLFLKACLKATEQLENILFTFLLCVVDANRVILSLNKPVLNVFLNRRQVNVLPKRLHSNIKNVVNAMQIPVRGITQRV